ncbi:hypothetical protein NDU88_000397 [Pleurodeles waltl]|uniref:Uncharacterized protein n=1 Tax=Pleurodeles waltl TaxID=8319 RepID=A0AAV7S6X4_PLEWA|nr:hypothetical protein NDU88_000397 [Pleurodeles waltl]
MPLSVGPSESDRRSATIGSVPGLGGGPARSNPASLFLLGFTMLANIRADQVSQLLPHQINNAVLQMSMVQLPLLWLRDSLQSIAIQKGAVGFLVVPSQQVAWATQPMEVPSDLEVAPSFGHLAGVALKEGMAQTPPPSGRHQSLLLPAAMGQALGSGARPWAPIVPAAGAPHH